MLRTNYVRIMCRLCKDYVHIMYVLYAHYADYVQIMCKLFAVFIRVNPFLQLCSLMNH